MITKTIATTITIIGITLSSFAQNAKCDSIKEMPMGSAMFNSAEINHNLTILLECGEYDEQTKKYFSEEQNVFGLVSEDIMKYNSESKYTVLLDHIDTKLKDEEFKEDMWYSMEMDRINQEPGTLKVFESNEPFFRRVEPDEVVFEELRAFLEAVGLQT